MNLPSDAVILAVGGTTASFLAMAAGLLGSFSLQGASGAVMLGANLMVVGRALAGRWKKKA